MQNRIRLKTVFFCSAFLFVLLAGPVHARTDARMKVLILNSYHKGFQWTDDQVASAKKGLEQRFEDLEIFVEYMDAKRIYNAAYLRSLKQFYGLKYKSIDLDAVITTDDIALSFMLDHHKDLFRNAPLSFCGVNNHKASVIKDRMPRISGVVEVLDITSTLDLALEMHPHTKQIAVVVDYTPTGLGQLRDIKAAASQYSNIGFRYLQGQNLSHEQLFDQLRSLPEQSIVLLAVWLRDKNEEYLSPAEGGRRIVQNAPGPVYGLIDMYFGHGIIGGQLLNSETHGRIAAEKAVQLIKGRKTSDVPIVRASTNPYMFDYEQVERWGIDRETLPQKSIIINQPFSFYKEYKGLIFILGIVFLALFTLVLFLSFNIVRRKRTERRLSTSEEKYRILVENANDAIYVTQDGKIKFKNPRTDELTGRSNAELIDQSFADTIHPEDREMVMDRHQRRLAGENLPSTYSFRIINKAGEVLWVELNTVRIRWEDRPASLNFIRNITEQKKLEDQLQQAQKMEAIGTLAGGIAHDFNNILSSVIGYTELSLDEVEKGSFLHSNLSEVMIAGNRAKNLVARILTLSRHEEQEKKPLPVAPLVKEALKMLRSTIPTSIDFREHISNENLIVHADPTQIHQVIMNLATNAVHAMADREGLLEVWLQPVRFDDSIEQKYVDIAPGHYVQITVSDTGCGIPAAHLDKIFEPYYTTKEKGHGTGLGLSVVHGIVKSHDGHVTVYSEPGRGAKFHVYLPLEEARFVGLPDYAAGPMPGGNEHILLVDDEPPIVKMQQQVLENLGYQTEARTSSIEALKAFQGSHRKFDLVITDMTMPQMTGEKLAQALKEISPDMPVILCTGFSERIEGREEELSIDGILMKPIAKQQMAETVRAVLDAGKKK